MNARKRGIKNTLIWFVCGLSLLSITTYVLAARSSLVQEETVQLGQWKIRSNSFEVRESAAWNGSAEKDDSTIWIYIYKDPNTEISWGNSEKDGLKINIPGIESSLFDVERLMSAEQMPENLQSVRLEVYMICDFNRQKFIFKRTSDLGRKLGTKEEREEFINDSVQKALAGASSDPLVSFAKLFFSKKVEIAKQCISRDYPYVDAAIDDNNYVELKYPGIMKGADYGWKLPAQPGQKVKFHLRFNTEEMTVTTHGLEVRNGYEFASGKTISVDDRVFIFDNNGIAQIDYGILKGPEMLTVKYQGWNFSHRVFKGHVFLRWGRSEEDWLNHNYFPLADIVSNASLDNGINNLLHDLNIAFDWDRNCWIVSRSEDGDKYYPDYCDISALEGLDMTDYSQLNTIEKKQVVAQWLKQYFNDILYKTPYQDTGKIALDEIRSIQESLFNASGLKLWEKMVPYKSDEPSGWHNPFEVYMLAYLWKEYPELQQGNPIKKVLDFWFEAMKENPDPVEYAGKTSLWIDDSIYSRAYAIASLNLGYELFKKTEYKEACNVQIKRFREYLQEKGILDSIQKSEGWVLETDTWHYSRSGRQMCEAVSLYGQVCALIGDKEGLKQAQNWIKTALTREGTQGQNPFRNYESATFKDRCGFIAVLRGKSTFSELPLKKDVLLN